MTTAGVGPLGPGLLVRVGVLRAYLVAKGAAYLAIGWSWLAFRSPSRSDGIEWVPWLTTWGVGAAWIVGGLIALIAGLTGCHRRAGFAALQSVAFFLAMTFLVSATVKGALLIAVILGAIALHWSPSVTPLRSIAVWSGAAALAVLVLAMPHVALPGGDFRSITTAISYGAFWVSALLMAQVQQVEGVVHGAAR